MKSIIIYNTRSGNTELLGTKMKEILEKYGHECDLYRDKNIKTQILTQNDFLSPYNLLCIGSCVHGNAPAFFPFRKIMKKIATLDLTNKKMIVFATSGGPKGWIKTCGIIRKKLPNINPIANIGCEKKENKEALKNFDNIIKNLKT